MVMSKKVLIISSSPRKGGNSDILCDEFLKGNSEAGHNVEKIFLKDKTINYYTGCGRCINKEKGCSQKDDMTEILEKMVSSDVIVLATPVYFYTMCAQIKTLIDRCCARYTEISNKDFYFIVTAADTENAAMERTLNEFRGFTYCLEGANEKGVIYGTGAWNKGDIIKTHVFKKAFEMGLMA
jgi:multimeric flavodoxin WrbA